MTSLPSNGIGIFERTKKAFGYIVRTWKARVAICLILVLSLVVNSLVLNQRYTEGDEKYDRISQELYSTFLGFSIAIALLSFLVVFYLGKHNQFGTTVMFTVLVIWTLLPEILLLYSRPGCSVSSLESAVTINAIVSVVIVGLLLIWAIPSTIMLKGETFQTQDEAIKAAKLANTCKGRSDGYTNLLQIGDDVYCHLPEEKGMSDYLYRYRVDPKTNQYTYLKDGKYENCAKGFRCKYRCINVPNDWIEEADRFRDFGKREYCEKETGFFWEDGKKVDNKYRN